jgi:hypothetical protein
MRGENADLPLVNARCVLFLTVTAQHEVRNSKFQNLSLTHAHTHIACFNTSILYVPIKITEMAFNAEEMKERLAKDMDKLAELTRGASKIVPTLAKPSFVEKMFGFQFTKMEKVFDELVSKLESVEQYRGQLGVSAEDHMKKELALKEKDEQHQEKVREAENVRDSEGSTEVGDPPQVGSVRFVPEAG